MNSARVPRPSVVLVDSLAVARITAPGFPLRIHAKVSLIKGSKGFPSGSRVVGGPSCLLSLCSYNRSLLPTRKALKEPTSDERGAFLRSVVFPAFFSAHFVRTRESFLTYNRLASSTLSDAGSISRGSFPDDPLPVRYAFLSSRPYLFGSFPYPIS